MARDFDESDQTGPGTGTSRAMRGLVACAAIALSLLVHWVGLAWVAMRLGVFSPPDDLHDDPVEVTMVTPPPSPPVASPDVPLRTAPATPPRARPVPKPAPRKPVEPPAAAQQTVPSPAVAVDERPAAIAQTTPPDASPDAGAGDSPGGPGDPVARSDADGPGPPPSDPATPPMPPEPSPPLYGKALGDPPRAGEWPYYFHYGDYTDGGLKVAEVTLQLTYDGDTYRVQLQGEARGFYSLLPKFKGMLVFSSQGTVGPNGLMPRRYSDRRPGRDERWAAVDYEARAVNFSRNNASAPLVDGAQDLMSALWQLSMLVQAMPEKAALGEAIDLPVIGSRAIDRVSFVSRGVESLATDRGPISALHFAPTVQGIADDRLDVWFGVDEGMVPVRIRLTSRRGEVFDLLWRR